jgi:hypothetical protein
MKSVEEPVVVRLDPSDSDVAVELLVDLLLDAAERAGREPSDWARTSDPQLVELARAFAPVRVGALRRDD